MKIVILGLSITSSWGNGHATCYRGLVRELDRQGHDVLFLERDMPWYASQRDLPDPPWGTTLLYQSLDALKADHVQDIRDADAVIVGSYVPEGVAVGGWVTETARGVTGFYDIDTPVTLAKLARGDYEYLSPDLVPRYRLYLSFTGGPTLTTLEKTWRSPEAQPLYCAFDPDLYYPQPEIEKTYALSYMGTYSDDRQSPLEKLMLEAARQSPEKPFVVAGPQYPDHIAWPRNVARIEHLPPSRHREFYNRSGFTLNITRADMIRAGWSPSVRLFEAAACATPIISDVWDGLTDLFPEGDAILLSRSAGDTLAHLTLPDEARRAIGEAARRIVLFRHTAAHRAEELVEYIRGASG